MKKTPKRILAALLAALMLTGLTACQTKPDDGTDTTVPEETKAPEETADPRLPVENDKNVVLYVAPDGDDATGNPYKTLEGAKNAVRAIDKTNLESITVCFREGKYPSVGTTFTEEDSGTENCIIRYMAYPGEEVIIGNDKTVPYSAFHKVEDEAMLARLQDDAKDKVLVASLADAGVTEEDCQAMAAMVQNPMKKASVFANGIRQTCAQYPDAGEYLLSGNLVKINDEHRRFQLKDDIFAKVTSWELPSDIWMFGYWVYDWSDSYHKLESVDMETKVLTMVDNNWYGYQRNKRYFYLNVFEELTVPGEWYIDWENGNLYYYPGEDFENTVISISYEQKTLISGSNASYLEFDNLIFQGSQDKAFNGTWSHLTLDHCVIRSVGYYGIWLNQADYTTIRSCEFAYTGGSGLDINGGNRETLEESHIVIEDCHFHDYGQIERISYGIWLRGVGIQVAHNEFAHAPHGGIHFDGNDHIIEYNEFYDLDRETDDGGVIYSGRHYDYYGNVIRYNYFHDILAIFADTVGNHDAYAPYFIYEDDGLCGTTVYANLFVADGEPHYSSCKIAGFDSFCQNNVFISTWGGIHCAGVHVYDENANDEITNFLRQVPFQSDAWVKAYPQMDKYRHGSMTTFPEISSFVTNNLFFDIPERLTPGYYLQGDSDEFFTVEDNSYIDLAEAGSYFVDPENGNYTFRDDAPIFTENPNFEAIPFAEMGRLSK